LWCTWDIEEDLEARDCRGAIKYRAKERDRFCVRESGRERDRVRSRESERERVRKKGRGRHEERQRARDKKRERTQPLSHSYREIKSHPKFSDSIEMGFGAMRVLPVAAAATANLAGNQLGLEQAQSDND